MEVLWWPLAGAKWVLFSLSKFKCPFDIHMQMRAIRKSFGEVRTTSVGVAGNGRVVPKICVARPRGVAHVCQPVSVVTHTLTAGSERQRFDSVRSVDITLATPMTGRGVPGWLASSTGADLRECHDAVDFTKLGVDADFLRVCGLYHPPTYTLERLKPNVSTPAPGHQLIIWVEVFVLSVIVSESLPYFTNIFYNAFIKSETFDTINTY